MDFVSTRIRRKGNQANVKLVCASFQLEDATVNLDT